MNYHTLILIHRIVVSLFLLHYVIKFLLLLLNKDEQLTSYTKATKIAEMILSVGFLLTGGWLLYSAASFGTLMIVKLVAVFASIPLAVVGFKKKNKLLAALSVVLLLAAYGLAEANKGKQKREAAKQIDTTTVTEPIEIGKLIYSEKCAVCHGSDGKSGLSGAKDLSVTQLTTEEQKAIIRNGKTTMYAFPADAISDTQLDALTQYLATLKQ